MYSASTCTAFATAASVFCAASVALLAASVAVLAAASALVVASPASFVAASATAADALAVTAASSAGFESSFTGALTTVSPRMAGRLTTPSSVLTVSSSSTLWLSVFIWFTTSCTSSFFSSSVSAIVVYLFCYDCLLMILAVYFVGQPFSVSVLSGSYTSSSSSVSPLPISRVS